jgi:membrane protease YdiL (CAAX protease family)
VAAFAVGAAVSGLPPDQPLPQQVLTAGLTIYVGMAAVALGWLMARDRLDQLPLQAFGRHGPWVAAGVGLAAGLLLASGLAWSSSRLPALRELDAVMVRTFHASGDATTLVFVLAGAIAEELLFRLAMQDALGLFGAVALYSVMYSCIGGWRLLLFTVPHALLLGMLMHFGFGLLGSTTANAIMNHLNLRRLRC